MLKNRNALYYYLIQNILRIWIYYAIYVYLKILKIGIWIK